MWSPLITHSSVDDPNKSFGVDIEFRYMILSKKNVITYYYPVEYGVGGGVGGNKSDTIWELYHACFLTSTAI